MLHLNKNFVFVDVQCWNSYVSRFPTISISMVSFFHVVEFNLFLNSCHQDGPWNITITMRGPNKSVQVFGTLEGKGKRKTCPSVSPSFQSPCKSLRRTKCVSWGEGCRCIRASGWWSHVSWWVGYRFPGWATWWFPLSWWWWWDSSNCTSIWWWLGRHSCGGRWLRLMSFCILHICTLLCAVTVAIVAENGDNFVRHMSCCNNMVPSCFCLNYA